MKFWRSGTYHILKYTPFLTDNASSLIAAFQAAQEPHESASAEDEASDVDESDGDSDEVCYESVGSGEAQELETQELEHEVAFLGYRRLSCFAYTLQLIVQKFNDVRSVKQALNNAYKLVKRVNKSAKATEMLTSLCGKKLVSNCPTRWSSTFLLVERLLQVCTSLTAVIEKQEWDNLAASEWKLLEGIDDLLQPFAQYTTLVGGEMYTTVSAV